MESSRSRPYLCKLCGRKVHTISALQQHTRIHRSIFPYQCLVCSKSFRLLSQLKGHQLLHDNERPLMCSWCDDRFLEQYQLRQHLLRKHKITPSSIGTKLIVATPDSLTVQTYNMILKKSGCTMVDDAEKIVAEVNHEDQTSEDGQHITQVISASNTEPQPSVESVMSNGEVSDDAFSEIKLSAVQRKQPSGSPMDSDKTVNENAAVSEAKSGKRAKRKLALEEPFPVEDVLDDADGASLGESKTVNEIESFMDMNGNAMADNELRLGDPQNVIEIESDTDTIMIIDVDADADVRVPLDAVTGKGNPPVQADDAEVKEAIMLLTGLQDANEESSGEKEMAAGGETLGEEPGFHLAMMTDDDSRSLTNTSDPNHHVLRGDPSLHVCPSRDDLFSLDENVAFIEDPEMMERAKPSSSELSMVPTWSSSCGNLAGLMLTGTPQKLSVDPGAASVNASPAMSPFRATIGHGGSDSEDSDIEVKHLENVEPLASMAESGDQGTQGPVTADKESSISPGHTEASNDLPIQPNAINFIKTDMSSFPNLKSFSGQEHLQTSTLDELKSLTDNVRKCSEEDLYKGFISLPKSLPTNVKLVNGVFCRTDLTPVPTPIIPEKNRKTVNPELKHPNEKNTDLTPRLTYPIVAGNPQITGKSELKRLNEKKTETTPRTTSPVNAVTPETKQNEKKTETPPRPTSRVNAVAPETTQNEKKTETTLRPTSPVTAVTSETKQNEKKTKTTPRPTSPVNAVTPETKQNEKKTKTTPRPTSPVTAVTSETKQKEVKSEATLRPTSPIIPVTPEIAENPEIKHLSEMKKEKGKVVKIVQAEPLSRRLRAKSDPLPQKRKRKRTRLDEDFLYDFEESPPKKIQEQGSKPMRQFSDIFQDFISKEKPDVDSNESPPPSPPPVKRQRVGRRSASVLDTSASESDVQVAPKRRGRPPKSAKPVENGDLIPEVERNEKESSKQTPVPNKNNKCRRAKAGKRKHSVKWDDSYDESDTAEVSESDSSTKETGSKDSNSGDNAPEYNLRPKRRKNFRFLQDDAIFDCECCTNGDKRHHKSLNIPHYVEHVNKVHDMRVLITRLIRTVFPDLRYPNLFHEGGLAVEYLMDEIMGACTEQHHKRKLGTPFGKVQDKVQVVLCKFPLGCLRHLRQKAMRLLNSLLPGIQSEGLEPSEINSLIEQVIETNQNAIPVDQPGEEL